jgi:hypothetical protein
VDDAVSKALARVPADRFASAREFMNVLTATTTGRTRITLERRRRGVLPLVLGGVGATAFGAALVLWFSGSWPGIGSSRSTTDSAAVAAPPAASPPADTTPGAPSGLAAAPRPDSDARTPASPGAGGGAGSAAPGVAASATDSEPRTAGAERRPTRALPEPRRAPSEPAAPRMDDAFASVASTAGEARRSALSAGAGSAELAPGDSMVGVARALAARGRWEEAIERLSAGTRMFGEAERAAARRQADPPRVRAETAAPPPVAAPVAPRTVPQMAARESASALSPAEARAGIERALDRYARAVESRSIAELRAAYPGMTAAQQQSWERFFSAIRTVRAELALASLDVAGDQAVAQITGRYEYTAAGARGVDVQPVAFHATFRREGSAWRLSAVRQ